MLWLGIAIASLGRNSSHLSLQPCHAATARGRRDKCRDQSICHQYRADLVRRTLRGIDEQIAEAEKSVAGKVYKRNRFVSLKGGQRRVNRTLKAKPCRPTTSAVLDAIHWRTAGAHQFGAKSGIKSDVALYRMALGQAHQEDLLEVPNPSHDWLKRIQRLTLDLLLFVGRKT